MGIRMIIRNSEFGIRVAKPSLKIIARQCEIIKFDFKSNGKFVALVFCFGL